METIGILKAKFETQRVSDRFQKREFVITTEANTPYPQQIQFQVTQDKCSLLDQYQEGQEIKVQFNLRGREWNGPQGLKYFNTLDAWRIEATGTSFVTTAVPTPPAQTSAPVINQTNDGQDLPF